MPRLLGEVSRQRLKEILAGVLAATLRQKRLNLFDLFALGDVAHHGAAHGRAVSVLCHGRLQLRPERATSMRSIRSSQACGEPVSKSCLRCR